MAVSISASRPCDGRATPTGGPFLLPVRIHRLVTRSAGTLADVPSRDEDLDWLYGRDKPSPSEPEPTQVMPVVRPLRAVPRAARCRRTHPTRRDRSAQPAGRTAGWRAADGTRQAAPEQSAPFDTSQYARCRRTDRARADHGVPGLASGRRHRRVGPARPRWTQRAHREAKRPRKRHPVRNVFLIVLLLVLADRHLAGRGPAVRLEPGPAGRRHTVRPSARKPAGHDVPAGRLRLPGGADQGRAEEARHRQRRRPADRHDHDHVHPAEREAGADLASRATRTSRSPGTARTRSTPRTPSAGRSCWSRPSSRTPDCGSTATWRSVSAASSTSSTRSAGSNVHPEGDQGHGQHI